MSIVRFDLNNFETLASTDGVYIFEVSDYNLILVEFLAMAEIQVIGFVQEKNCGTNLTSHDIPIISLHEFSEGWNKDKRPLLFSEHLVNAFNKALEKLGLLGISEYYDPWSIMQPFTQAKEWFYIANALRFYSDAEKGVLYDIGSNRGGATEIALEHYKAIIGIDANPTMQNFYTKKFKDQDHVQLICSGIGARKQQGKNTFYLDTSDTAGGSSLFYDNTYRHRVNPVEEIEVDVQTLEDVCTKLNIYPTFIKLDIEGSEPDAILSSKDLIIKHRPVLLFECWSDSWAKGVRDLYLFLEQQGYSVYSSIAGGDLWDIFENGYSLGYVTNALCLPETHNLPTIQWHAKYENGPKIPHLKFTPPLKPKHDLSNIRPRHSYD